MISAYIIIKEESVRVPNKNFKILIDRPLYQWILDTLSKVDEINEIIINTDCPHLINEYCSKNNKIKVINRKVELRGNDITANTLISDDINHFQNDIILMSHATNPFIKEKTIKESIKSFINSNCSSSFSVSTIQGRVYDESKKPLNHDFKNLIPTQNLPRYYFENSSLYLFTKEFFKKFETRINQESNFFEISKVESHDIDDLEDWFIAEAMAKEINSNS